MNSLEGGAEMIRKSVKTLRSPAQRGRFMRAARIPDCRFRGSDEASDKLPISPTSLR